MFFFVTFLKTRQFYKYLPIPDYLNMHYSNRIVDTGICYFIALIYFTRCRNNYLLVCYIGINLHYEIIIIFHLDQ